MWAEERKVAREGNKSWETVENRPLQTMVKLGDEVVSINAMVLMHMTYASLRQSFPRSAASSRSCVRLTHPAGWPC